jgi:bifunctional enzyme CysN/CysC
MALDGLAAEREQGITIDVCYRSLSTPRRRFLIADVPGHEQYTRNMITGASTADVAVLVIDARYGILQQTRRHSYLASLLGIRHLILAVNKIDLVEFSEQVFRRIASEYEEYLGLLGEVRCYTIPVSAKFGDNVTARSLDTSWYAGPTLADILADISVEEAGETAPFRFPVQWLNRSREDMRAYGGVVASGAIAVGERIRVQPSGQEARVTEIFTFDGRLDRAIGGQCINLVLDAQLDVGRGHLIAGTSAAPACGDTLYATLIWMGDSPLLRGRSYRLKIGTMSVLARVLEITHQIDIDTLASHPVDTLTINQIGTCTLRLEQAVAFDIYDHNRDTGGFILIDRVTNETVAAGLVRAGELKSDDVPWQRLEVSRSSRSALKQHPPGILWFTGISGAGKSTIANLVEKKLHARHCHTYLLDGDNVRHGLNRDLGFTDGDRVENVRRMAEVAKLMADAGLLVLVALISPFRAERRSAREMLSGISFIEIFVDTPLQVAEARDSKGLYRKARRGELSAFTGIDSKYESPEHPELHIETTKMSAEQAAEVIAAYVERHLLRREGNEARLGRDAPVR